MLFCSVCNKLIADSGYDKVHYGICSSCPIPDVLIKKMNNTLLTEVLNILEQTEGLGMDEFSKYRREFERLDMLEELNTNLNMVNAELRDRLIELGEEFVPPLKEKDPADIDCENYHKDVDNEAIKKND